MSIHELSAYRGNETLPPRTLTKLNILVHPSFQWNIDPGSSVYFNGKDYEQTIRETYGTPIESLLPQTDTELLLLMPDSAKRVAKRHKTSNSFVILPTWDDLYKSLKQRSELPQNIRLINNIVPVPFNPNKDNFQPDVTKIINQKLARWGFRHDSSTRITLGGQWLEQCVLSAANNLLEDGFTDELLIDRALTLVHARFYGDNPQLIDPKAANQQAIEVITARALGQVEVTNGQIRLSANQKPLGKIA